MGTIEQLIEKIQSGENVKENQELVFNEIYFDVRKEVLVHYGFRDDVEDLIQDACIIVLDMIKKYDNSRGASFKTYMRNYLILKLERVRTQSDSCFIVSHKMQRAIKKYNQFLNDFFIANGRTPTENELQFGLGCSAKKISQIKDAIRFQKHTSTNEIIDESENTELEEIIEDERANFEEESIEKLYQSKLKDDIWECISLLEETKQELIYQKYFKGLNLTDISKNLGIPLSRIYWLEKKILGEMKRNRYIREKLTPYLNDETIYSESMRGTGLNTFRNTGMSSTERTALRQFETKEKLLSIFK